MTAQILQLRDYKRPEERQAEIDRACLAVVDEALNRKEPEYGGVVGCKYWVGAPDEGDCG